MVHDNVFTALRASRHLPAGEECEIVTVKAIASGLCKSASNECGEVSSDGSWHCVTVKALASYWLARGDSCYILAQVGWPIGSDAGCSGRDEGPRLTPCSIFSACTSNISHMKWYEMIL